MLEATNGEYYGGHKAIVAGGFINKFEYGKMFLTDSHFIFIKDTDTQPQNNFHMIIPLQSVIADDLSLEEEARRQQISGIGGVIGPGIGIGLGSGVMRSKGKAHHIVIPYTDENGVFQQPRFGISSFGGKAIRIWSQKVYEQIIIVRNNFPSKVQTIKTLKGEQQDPLTVLKLRLAKGEINEEAYERLKKLLESE